MRSIVVALLLATLTLTAFAADWPAALRQAEERCNQQHASYNDITIVQDMITNTSEGPLEAVQHIYQSQGRTRMEMTMQLPEGAGLDSMQTIIIDNGKETWMINPFAGKQKLDEAQAAQQELPHDCWGFTAENSHITGDTTFQDQPCYVVELSRDSVKHRLWLDKESLQVLGGESADGSSAVNWRLSDFRPVTATYKHPYKVEMFEGDVLISTMTVRSVAVNTNLADDLFDVDKVEAPQIDMQELMRRALEAEGMEADSLAPDSLR
jgi:outer membrane lipoprotein-sorting protein